LTEELIDALASLPGLRVVARTASPRWTDKELEFANLRKLGIDKVVEGSVRKEGSKVRISVRLVDATNASHLWSAEYDREIRDSIVTEQEIATAIAATLKLRLTPGALPTIKPPNPEAYELYLKGRYSWHQYDAASALKGIAYLERSLSLDPSFAPACNRVRFSPTRGKKILEKYPKGSKVDVLFDPQHPSTAVLEKGGSTRVMLFAGVAVIAGSCLVGFLIGSL
jgi:hypothetical protein